MSNNPLRTYFAGLKSLDLGDRAQQPGETETSNKDDEIGATIELFS